MANHTTRRFILARIIFGSAAAVLLVLVGWIAVRSGGGDQDSGGKPLMVLPTGVVQAAAEGSLPPSVPPLEAVSASPSASLPASASVSPSPSASASRSPSASASPSVKPKPSKSTGKPSAGTSPSRTPSPTPTPDTLSVTYSTGASWRDGFISAIRVTNNGSAAREWAITLTYPSNAGIDVRGAWNASASGGGDTVTLRGSSLAAGASINVGFQAGKRIRDVVKPVSCSVGGGSCRVS